MKNLLYSFGIGAAIGAAFIWYAYPRHEVQIKTETKVVTEYKTKIVEKWTKAPDGNETRERIEETSGSINKTKKKDKKIAAHDWMLGIQAKLSTDVNGLQYGLRIERRIVGPIFAGLYVTTTKEAGVSLGLEF